MVVGTSVVFIEVVCSVIVVVSAIVVSGVVVGSGIVDRSASVTLIVIMIIINCSNTWSNIRLLCYYDNGHFFVTMVIFFMDRIRRLKNHYVSWQTNISN